MSKLARSVAVTALCVLLAGCEENFPPIQSGEVTLWQQRRPQGAAQALTPAQAAAFSAWLQHHRRGWQHVMVTYAPAVLILAVQADGAKYGVNLRPDVLIVGQRERAISASEYRELLAILGIPPGD